MSQIFPAISLSAGSDAEHALANPLLILENAPRQVRALPAFLAHTARAGEAAA